MLRFQNDSNALKPVARRVPGRERLRLWLLVLLLGLVLVAMRRMQHPDTLQKMGQLFGLDSTTADSSANNGSASGPVVLQSTTPPTSEAGAISRPIPTRDGAASEKAEQAAVGQVSTDTPGNDPPGGDLPLDSLLLEVEDNSAFRLREQPAWFAIFSRLQQLSSRQLSEQSLGELSYAQLLQQPGVYRGRVVKLRGTLQREETLNAPANLVGIEQYHRLWLQPAGGGQWPFVVYCLRLPREFPRGDRLRVPVEVTGFFFKNWSYSWDDGLGLAPVVLAAEVGWDRQHANKMALAVEQRPKPVTWKQLLLGGVAAGAVAAVVSMIVWTRTRRRCAILPGKTGNDTDKNIGENIGEALGQLPKQEQDA